MEWVALSAGLLIVGAIVILFIRRKSATVDHSVVPIENSTESAVSPPTFRPPTFAFLQGLSFEEAVDETVFGNHLVEAIQNGLTASARQFAPDLANAGLQVGSLGQDGWWVTFPDGQHYDLVRKVSTGELIPQAQLPDGFGPHAVVDHTAMFVNQLAGVSAIGVSLCHMVSGADNSRKLGAVLKNQSTAFAHRRNDHKNQVKTSYQDLQKMLRRQASKRTSFDYITSRLREARHNILDDVLLTLHNLQPLFPEHQGLLKIPKEFRDSVLRRPGTTPFLERQAVLAEVVGQLRLAAASLRFEHLALCAGEEPEEVSHLFKDAERSVERVLELFEERERELIWASDEGEPLTPVLASLFSGHSRLGVEP